MVLLVSSLLSTQSWAFHCMDLIQEAYEKSVLMQGNHLVLLENDPKMPFGPAMQNYVKTLFDKETQEDYAKWVREIAYHDGKGDKVVMTNDGAIVKYSKEKNLIIISSRGGIVATLASEANAETTQKYSADPHSTEALFDRLFQLSGPTQVGKLQIHTKLSMGSRVEGIDGLMMSNENIATYSEQFTPPFQTPETYFNAAKNFFSNFTPYQLTLVKVVRNEQGEEIFTQISKLDLHTNEVAIVRRSKRLPEKFGLVSYHIRERGIEGFFNQCFLSDAEIALYPH